MIIKFHHHRMNKTIPYLSVDIKYSIIFVIIIYLNPILTGCSTTNAIQNINPSGDKLLYYADQYREISSLMVDNYLEDDYDSINTLLYEAVDIAQNVKNLDVDKEFEQARTYAENWMYSDAYWFYLAISGGSQATMDNAFEDSMDYLTLFLTEMELFGYEFK